MVNKKRVLQQTFTYHLDKDQHPHGVIIGPDDEPWITAGGLIQ